MSTFDFSTLYTKIPREKLLCVLNEINDLAFKGETRDTARKTVFPRSWNIMESSKRPSKYHLSINFLAEKRSYFPITEKFKTRTSR